MMKNATALLLLVLALTGACARDDDDHDGTNAEHDEVTAGADSDERAGAGAEHDDVDESADDADYDAQRRAAAPAETDPAPSQDPAPAQAASNEGSGDPARANDGNATGAAANAPTAQDQPVGTTDEDITVQIRQAIVGDDSLSMAARNVTIVTRSGVVTLRGALPREERGSVERHARGVAGVRRVDNRITVRN